MTTALPLPPLDLQTLPGRSSQPAPGDTDYPGDDGRPVPDYELTDLGNARRLCASHGQRFRYAPSLGAWLAYDGCRWAADITGEIDRAAKAAAEDILDQARAAKDEKLFRHGIRSQSAGALKAAIGLAATEPGIPVLIEDLDRDPMLLNTTAGTIDLRSGQVRAARRNDLITKLSPVAYDPAATCPTWDRFLGDVFGNDELIGFVRRAVGYCLTGHVNEQILLFCHGAGANGKSTFLNVLRAVFGDYGLQLDPAVLSAGSHEQHPTGLTDLRGARFVATIETEQGRRLNEALVKQLTGGDPIRARRMHRDYFEFQPTHKLWIAGNHLPRITGTDLGIWRRVALLPFDADFTGARADRLMGQRLASEAPGILAWAVRGCLEWQRDGLRIPERITAATAEYRCSQDHIGRFLADRCHTGDTAWVSSKALRAAYEQWCAEQGERPWTAQAMGRELSGRGFDSGRFGSERRAWIGVGLAVEEAA